MMTEVLEPLSVLDHAWLRMDRPTNLMMIGGLMIFSGPLELARVKALVDGRLLCFHRLRQRVRRVDGDACWETDPDFDLDWHVRQQALPARGGRGALERMVGDLISTALDPDKPMWQMHLIDTRDGCAALLLRIHHCYGDGYALSHLMGSLTDACPDHEALPASDLGPLPTRRAAWEHLLGPLTEWAGDGVRLAHTAYTLAQDWAQHPAHAAELARRGLGLAAELTTIAAMEPDSATRFKGALGVMKRVAWTAPLALHEVKAVADALACSVNDVLLSCVTAALRRYLLAQGDPVDQTRLRVLVPVNLRPPGPLLELGNHFGLVFLTLPLGVADALARTREVGRRMAALKQSQQATVALGILACMGVAPAGLRLTLIETLAANATAVVTNLRGAPRARYFAGRRIERQMFWVPQSGGIGLGVSILSYAGQVTFGILSDVQRVPDPATLAGLIVEEFQTLLLQCLTMPWPEPG